MTRLGDQPARPPDAGMGTVLVLAVMALVLTVSLVGLLVGAAVTARHQAGAAADFAALAAARRALHDPATACSAAESVAVADHAWLVRCRLTGAIAEVTAAVQLPGVLARWGSVTARARAGPVPEIGSR